ncbi:hypothetical protein UPYG_G00022900 [Umbra pygmaea]|uniref:Ig-like domain-containing protein n=1 Tax=Umbra pygmaea TaxID=75934 RepID=A0ABD0XZT7_UMBPY
MPSLRNIVACFLVSLACTVFSVVADNGIVKLLGGELVLMPDISTVTGPISNIIWKLHRDKVAEWDNDFGEEIYGRFKLRTTLNRTTGLLKITGLTKEDNGVYSLEINSKLLDKTYTLSVIKAVPKPEIIVFCTPNKISCLLTCEGDTADSGLLKYSWKLGDTGSWEYTKYKELNVSRSETSRSNNGYKYTCKMENAVSQEVSMPVYNVFGSDSTGVRTRDILGGVFGFFICVLLFVCLGICYRKKKGEASSAVETVYHTVGDGANVQDVPFFSMDTVYSTVKDKSSRHYSSNQNINSPFFNTGSPDNHLPPGKNIGNASGPSEVPEVNQLFLDTNDREGL